MGDELISMELKFCVDNQLLKSLANYQIGVMSVEELTNEELRRYLEVTLSEGLRVFRPRLGDDIWESANLEECRCKRQGVGVVYLSGQLN